MNTTFNDFAGAPSAPQARMRPWHMLSVVAGVLMAASGIGVLVTELPIIGLVLLLVGLTLIILGAVGLGRDIRTDPSGVEASANPVMLEAKLDPQLTRWMWLIKWLLAIPHYVVLVILWTAMVVVTVVAGFAILFTGRYPAPLFEFVLGVLRWNWRVAFFANGVLGTDRYPPFTLARTDYPATFEIAYPEHLSHWKVLFKSWLFALPHLLIIGIITTGVWASNGGGSGVSLLGLLAFIALVILLFTGVYRLGLFNLIMGIHRWIYRVTAYTALMRDDYPPFRLDQGPMERRIAPATS